MKLDKLLMKVYHLEGLVIALEILIDNYIYVQRDCLEEFNSVSALIRLYVRSRELAAKSTVLNLIEYLSLQRLFSMETKEKS